MSTSGISISSLLSALGSSSSGIDVTSAVDAAMEAIEEPEIQWEEDETTLNTQTSDLDSVETDVETLQSSLTALSDSNGALASMSATSSDTSLVEASAASGTTAGTHSIVVSNIATAASWVSDTVASSSTTLASGSFTLQVGSGTATTIQIGSSDDTLTELASNINSQDLGVTASVVTDSSGARLAIVSNNTGSANAVTVSNASGLTFTQASKGEDASLTVDGISIDSASNTVTGAVSGLTLNLVGADANETVSVSVTPDSSAVESAINSFVSAYNTAIGDVNTQYTVSDNAEGPLAGDATIQMLQTSLLSSGSYSGGGNGVATLADLGITMNKDGTLTVDSATLDNAVENNFSAVQNFLLGTSSDGFVSYLNTQLNTLTASGNGAFTIDLQSIATQISGLKTEVTNFQTYADDQQKLLTAEYNQADITLQEIPEKEAQINAELGYTSSSSSTNGV
jgi:flagellar hook-associated protein 2